MSKTWLRLHVELNIALFLTNYTKKHFCVWTCHVAVGIFFCAVASPLRKNAPQLLVRHSEIVNGNARLKGDINHLRKERTTTNEVHAQLEGGIHQVRGEIAALMTQASAMNDHREEMVKTKEVRRGGHTWRVKSSFTFCVLMFLCSTWGFGKAKV